MEYEKVTAMCVTVLDTKTAFALREDTGAQVFIPSTVASRVGLCPGDMIVATVVPNLHQPDRTPWFAIHVAKGDAGEPRQVSLLDDSVADFIAGQDMYVTTAEVAAEFDTDTTTASNALNRIFRRGQIARAEVHSRPDQPRPSLYLWAKEVSRFVEGIEG